MNSNEIGRVFQRAEDSFARAQQASARVNRSLVRADTVLQRADERRGVAGDAARRERQRLNAGLKKRAARVAVAIGIISIATVIFGFFQPIGLFGFLAAVGVALGIAGLLAFSPSGDRSAAAPAADLPNGEMVQRFDSYLFRTRRSLPAPAQAEIDGISAQLPALKQSLERVDALDPVAQDARRLMSIHLPGLLDRYNQVPADFRGQTDGEGLTVDERLVEGLAASRSAISEMAQRLARADLAALETQGRFIASRYGDQTLSEDPAREREER